MKRLETGMAGLRMGIKGLDAADGNRETRIAGRNLNLLYKGLSRVLITIKG